MVIDKAAGLLEVIFIGSGIIFDIKVKLSAELVSIIVDKSLMLS